MKRNSFKTKVCCLTSVVVLASSSMFVSAAPTAGLSKDISSNINTSATESTVAGGSLAFATAVADSKKEVAQKQKKDVPLVQSEYADVAIAQVDNFVNVRDKASEEGEVLGKLYDKSAATVHGEENGWYKITSGTVTGYVKKEFVVVGDEELAKSVSRRLAKVTTETLKVRLEPSLEAGVLGLVPEGDDLTVVEENVGWIKVSIEEGEGYVSTDYVELSTEYVQAESKAEEEARLAREEAERQAAAEAARRASVKASQSAARAAANAKSYAPPAGPGGQAVANYACQFVGNPYVYGGTSLTNGADCSGFVMSVYAAFGVSLPHSSSAMRSVGYAVSPDAMAPGDIVCYSGHVGIYVGNNTIVHASTPSGGIKYTSPANYRSIITVRRIF